MLAAFTVVLLALTSWLGAQHDATTIHVRCAQHGELIDGAALSTRAAAVRTSDASAAVACLTTSGGSGRGHEHCAISAATRASRIAPSSPVLAAAPVTTVARTIATGPVIAALDRARYRTAPKTSPPV